jgi:uncharacterized protein YabE (DUF348 family)
MFRCVRFFDTIVKMRSRVERQEHMNRTAITIRYHYRLIGLVLLVACTAYGVLSVRSVYAVGTEDSVSHEHIVTVHDDGQEKGFMTRATTLRQALADAGIRLDRNDRTEPGLDETLVGRSYEVNIYRARPVIVRDGSDEIRIMTSYRTGRQIAAQAGIRLRDEDTVTLGRSTNMMRDGVSEVLTIDYATPVTFIFYGKTIQAYTQAQTVGEMLDAKHITPSVNDTLSPSGGTPVSAGMVVQLWKNGEQTYTVDEDVPYESQKIYDMDKDKTYRQVQTPGVVGKRTVTYHLVMHNGVQVDKKELNVVVTVQPIKEVVVVGAKNNYSGNLNEWLLALRMCETHGNYSTNTHNGFYGAYQFMISTWDSIARKAGRSDLIGVLPSDAAPADQDAMIIANTNKTAGLVTQNPGCYAKTGISNKPPAS